MIQNTLKMNLNDESLVHNSFHIYFNLIEFVINTLQQFKITMLKFIANYSRSMSWNWGPDPGGLSGLDPFEAGPEVGPEDDDDGVDVEELLVVVEELDVEVEEEGGAGC